MPLQPDATDVNADARELARWSAAAIEDECRDAYRVYHDAVRTRHIAWYAARDEARSATHPFAAASRAHAFPPGSEALGAVIAEAAWHRYHLSGGSSQVLAVALLSAATRADPTLAWLLPQRLGGPAATLHEVELAPDVLNERPRQTSVDWLVAGRDVVVAAEAKFTEEGLGRCSCEDRPVCSARVMARPYWDVARRDLGLLPPDGRTCSLSVAYQAVRNVAAARAIAGPGRAGVFALLYDERNPYFSGAGSWPGWRLLLERVCRLSPVRFAPLSWQALLDRAPLAMDVREWAREKHGL